MLDKYLPQRLLLLGVIYTATTIDILLNYVKAYLGHTRFIFINHILNCELIKIKQMWLEYTFMELLLKTISYISTKIMRTHIILALEMALKLSVTYRRFLILKEVNPKIISK